MSARLSKYLRQENNFLHIGCNVIAPQSWINIDGSWNAWLSRYPPARKLLWKLGIIDKEVAQYPWPRNILIWDVSNGLAFPDNSIDGIYASHLLEHLSRCKAEFFIRECYRVLRSAGIIRLVLPDLRSYIDEYVQMKKEMPKSPLSANQFMERLRISAGWHQWENLSLPFRIYRATKDTLSHRWMYDRESLMVLLKDAGFKTVSEKKFLDSVISIIEDVERQEKEMSIYVEGCKLGGG